MELGRLRSLLADPRYDFFTIDVKIVSNHGCYTCPASNNYEFCEIYGVETWSEESGYRRKCYGETND